MADTHQVLLNYAVWRRLSGASCRWISFVLERKHTVGGPAFSERRQRAPSDGIVTSLEALFPLPPLTPPNIYSNVV